MAWYYIAGIGVFILVILVAVLKEQYVVKTDYSPDKAMKGMVYYYLPESMLKVKSTVQVAVIYEDESITEAEIISQNFSALTEIVADTGDLLALRYVSDFFSADEVKFEVNAKGLLETGHVVTEDRVPQIVNIITDAAGILPNFKGIKTVQEYADKGVKREVKIKEYSTEFAIRISEMDQSMEKIKWPLTIVNEYDKEIRGDGKSLSNFNLTADFEMKVKQDVEEVMALPDILNTGRHFEDEPFTIPGLVTRPFRHVSVEFTIIGRNGESEKSPAIHVPVADKSRVVIVPLRRLAFGKRLNNITMKDGIIHSHEIVNPSSFENFVSIPIKIARAIVSVPAQIIQFKIDTTKRSADLETAKLDYEKSIRENQKFILAGETELSKVRTENEKARIEYQKLLHEQEKFLLTRQLELDKINQENQNFMVSKQAELEKLKSDLNTALLKSEKERLDAAKALEEIKKQMENAGKQND